MDNRNQPMDAVLEGNNPKLQSVKYTNHLPEGKLGDYRQNERVDFMPDPATSPYFDGKQSYLHIRVTNTSTFTTNAAVGVIPPLCFPAHIGANALINRCVVRSKDNSQVIEDIEAYNQITGVKNSYTHDSDVFKTLSRISGIAGRTPCGMNQGVGDLSTNYFLPNGQTGNRTEITAGYEKKNVTRGEGDIWEENGKTWTIINGLKQTVTKHDKIRKLVQMPLVCPSCNKPMKADKLNTKMWKLHKQCFQCNITFSIIY